MPHSSLSRSTISEAHGFLIDGANLGAEFSVAGAGDVNGDGRADVMLGAPFAGPNGAVFVVYGKADTLAVDVGLAGRQGLPRSTARPATAPEVRSRPPET